MEEELMDREEAVELDSGLGDGDPPEDLEEPPQADSMQVHKYIKKTADNLSIAALHQVNIQPE